MFTDRKIYEEICETLAIIQQAIKNKGICGFHDDKKACENFFMGLFNIIYKLNFTNANSDSHQYPAIDLKDSESGCCYQITCENTSDKINDTKEKYAKHELSKLYPKLMIFIFEHKPKKRPKDDQVKYLADLFQDIEKLDQTVKIKINKYINDHIQILKQIKLDLEMETIQKVIRFLSNQLNISDDDDFSDIPYPEEKLSLRFESYSAVIKERYGELYSTYNKILIQAKSNHLDDGNSSIIKMYLRGKSRNFLYEEKDAKKALEKLTTYMMEQIGGGVYKIAVEFYLLSELINCDLFPLSKHEIEEIKKMKT